MEIIPFNLSKSFTFSSHAGGQFSTSDESYNSPPLDLYDVREKFFKFSGKPEPPVTQFCELEVVAIVSVIEDLLCHLSIIGCHDLSLVDKTRDPLYRTIEERVHTYFTASNTACIHDDGTVRSKIAILKENLQQNCIFLLQTFQRTVDQLISCGAYEPLQDYVIIPYFVAMEESDLYQSMKFNLTEVDRINEEIQAYNKLNDAEIDREKHRLQRMQGYLTRLKIFLEKERRYVDKWESTRRFQNLLCLKKTENNKSSLVENIERDKAISNYAHEIITEHLRQEMKELKLRMKDYEYRRNKDIEAIDWKTDVVKLRNRQVNREVEECKEKVVIMNNALQNERRLSLRKEAAKIIQSWWRTSVTHKFTPEQREEFKREVQKMKEKMEMMEKREMELKEEMEREAEERKKGNKEKQRKGKKQKQNKKLK